jgi:hypothetical protein
VANPPVNLKGGRELSTDLIEKLSSEAERGYDLTKAGRVILREGRPARGEPTGESPRVASRIPEVVFRAATQRARGEGLTVSQVIRALLTDYATGRSSHPVAGLGRAASTPSSDTDLTAKTTNKGVSAQTLNRGKRVKLFSRRTSAKVRGGKAPRP